MSVQVTGFRPWTSCKFWVITKDGQAACWPAAGWSGQGADKLWYPVYSDVPESSVRGFEITWGSHGVLADSGRLIFAAGNVRRRRHVYRA